MSLISITVFSKDKKNISWCFGVSCYHRSLKCVANYHKIILRGNNFSLNSHGQIGKKLTLQIQMNSSLGQKIKYRPTDDKTELTTGQKSQEFHIQISVTTVRNFSCWSGSLLRELQPVILPRPQSFLYFFCCYRI